MYVYTHPCVYLWSPELVIFLNHLFTSYFETCHHLSEPGANHLGYTSQSALGATCLLLPRPGLLVGATCHGSNVGAGHLHSCLCRKHFTYYVISALGFILHTNHDSTYVQPGSDHSIILVGNGNDLTVRIHFHNNKIILLCNVQIPRGCYTNRGAFM